MYVSRLSMHTLPGKTHEAEEELKNLVEMVVKAGGSVSRVLRTHFASQGAPDIVFEQQAQDLAMLESELKKVTDTRDFQQWTTRMSGLLSQPPKREIYVIVGSK
jgi:hypothetical protein